MGSLRFSTASNSSHFGENIAEATFKDIDGIEVSAALYLDQDGDALAWPDTWNRWIKAMETPDLPALAVLPLRCV